MTISKNLIMNIICVPTISFVDGYPRILTCNDHDGGWNLIQIHFCRWRNNIPSPVSDKVFHAVVKLLTVNHKKVGYNSTGYQMVEQHSSWKGLDNINISSVGRTFHNFIELNKIVHVRTLIVKILKV